MNKKRTIYFLLLVVLILVIILLAFLIKQNAESKIIEERVFPKEEPQQQQEEIKPVTSSIIPYPSEFNFAQTYNDCGPFNSAAVVRALTDKEVSSAEFAKTITHRLSYKWTLPEGLTEQLNQNGIATVTPDFSGLTDDEKIAYLKEQLILKHPVTLLIKKEDFQHYITLFGFNSQKDEFYIYDSLMERLEGGLTKDENGDLPGNKTISTKKLLEMWSGGGMLGKYTWFAIISSKNN